MRVEKLLVTQLVNCINENKDDIGLPCYVTFGAPQTLTGEAMWLQTLGGTREIKKYIRGKYKGELSLQCTTDCQLSRWTALKQI